MVKIINWIKRNKLATFLLLVVGYFLYRNLYGIIPLRTSQTPNAQRGGSQIIDFYPLGSSETSKGLGGIALSPIYPPQEEYAPQPGVQDRLVIQESNLSLQVTNVVDTRNKILDYATTNGGYMVNASTSSPEEAPFATVVIRIPSDKLQAALDYFHSLSVKVVSENLVGQDVTDQYIDIDTRIATYEKTKEKYQEILDKATTITDITNLTREIINIQTQIDSLKDQQNALEKNAQLAKLTIYLSTDEIALPYAPSEAFRPAVIFKLAVRSLVGFLRNLATLAIWLGVYAVIWVPALLIYIFARRWWKKRKSAPKLTN